MPTTAFPLPSRADHVGSLLRPQRLTAARAQARAGSITRGHLRMIEEECVREVVQGLESTGMQSITDGEFTRDWWHIDFLSAFDGVSNFPDPGVANFKGFRAEDLPPIMSVAGKIRRTKPVFVDYFKFLKTTTRRTAKQTLPSPAMLLMRGGYPALSKEAYPDRARFWEDLGAAYRAEIADLAAAGCTVLQIDDTSYSMLCDDNFRAMVRRRGEDPDELVHVYAHVVNLAVRDRPPGMTIAMHTCRGNFQSSWCLGLSRQRCRRSNRPMCSNAVSTRRPSSCRLSAWRFHHNVALRPPITATKLPSPTNGPSCAWWSRSPTTSGDDRVGPRAYSSVFDRKYGSTFPLSLMVSGLPRRSLALPAVTRSQPSLTQYSSTLMVSTPLRRMPTSCASTSAL